MCSVVCVCVCVCVCVVRARARAQNELEVCTALVYRHTSYILYVASAIHKHIRSLKPTGLKMDTASVSRSCPESWVCITQLYTCCCWGP